MVCIMVFVGESIPKFGKILSLVGGSTITLLTFVFPPFFYMRLCDQEKQQDWSERYFFLSICVISPFTIEFWYLPTCLAT
jgi:Transmembrane amino acid transporter protein.